MKHWIRKSVLLLLIIGGVIASVAWYSRRSNGSEVSYRTAAIDRGDLLATIGATGTVEPEEVIDVGARVSGEITTFGKDMSGKEVDYCSQVEEGAILAQIDDSVYLAQLDQTTAQLQQAQASLQSSTANLKQIEAKLYQAQRDWDRAQKLGPSEALAQSSFDAYQSAFETAKANVAVGQAAIEQSKAEVAQAQASHQVAKRNLGYCTIKSPVSGVIIDRRVNIGQTVAASLNAPSLFLIAKDLKRMQVWVSVNEVAVGSIRTGQPATFTVNAFGERKFKGQVGKVRLNASMTQNVVNYVVEVNTDNSDGALLPYLTADVKFEIDQRKNVLLVPNAALRWAPQMEQVAMQFRKSRLVISLVQSDAGAPPAGNPDTAAKAASPEQPLPDVIWIQDGQYVKPLAVKVGLTDGLMSEIQPLAGGIELSEFKEGMPVVLGEQVKSADDGNSGTVNPFTPQFRRR
jgi:HlyD family secretion protein